MSTSSAMGTRTWSVVSRSRIVTAPVVEGVEVDGDGQGRADLVLAAVAATDRLGVVVVGHHVRLRARP